MKDKLFTPAQCRAARAAVFWKQGDLARLAAVSTLTVQKFENLDNPERPAPSVSEASTGSKGKPRGLHAASIHAIHHAFTSAGIGFMEDGCGITWSEYDPQALEAAKKEESAQ